MATRNENIRYYTYFNDKEVGKSMNSLYNHSRKLKNEIRRLEIGSKEWVGKMQELDNVNKMMKPLNQRLRGMESPLAKLKAQAKGLLPAFGITAILAGLGRLGKEVLGVATKLQQIDKRARIVFGESFPKVSAEADRLAQKMGLTNKEFINAATNTGDLLIPLDFSREKAAQMSVELQSLAGALNEWNGGQLGAAEVSNILTKAMLGENEQLKQLGIAIRKDSEEFRNLVEQKMEDEKITKAQAEAMATLELIQKKSADAQTAYLDSGTNLLRMRQSLTLGIKKAKEWLAGLIIEEKKQSDIYVSQQGHINSLIGSITSLNEGNDIRARMIKDLNTYYPGLLEGIDAETVSNAELLKILKKVNLEYERKIQQAVLEEKMGEVTARNIELATDQYDATQRISDAYEKYIKDKKEGATLEEKYNALMDKELYDLGVMTKEWAELNDATGSVTVWDIISSHIGGVTENMNTYNDAQTERNELQEDYNRLMSDLSLYTPDPDPDPNPNPNPNPQGGKGGTKGAEVDPLSMGPFPMDEATQQFIDEQMAQYKQKLADFQVEVHELGLSGKEQDIYDTDQYYEQLKTQMDAFKQWGLLTDEEYKELEKSLEVMHEQELLRIHEHYLDEKKKKDKQALDFNSQMQVQAATATLNTYGNMIGAISSMYSEQSEEFKALSAFQATLSAIASAVSAYNSTAQIPIMGSVLAPIAAASALLYGFSQVRRIYSTKTPDFKSSYEWGGPTLPYEHQAKLAEGGEEYVIPNWLRSDPQVAAFEDVIESRRALGPTSITNNVTNNSSAMMASQTDPALVAMLEQTNGLLRDLKDKGVQGVWEWDRYREGFDEMSAVEKEARLES